MEPQYETWKQFIIGVIIGVLAISLYFLPFLLLGAQWAAGAEAGGVARGEKPEMIVNRPGFGDAETIERRGRGGEGEVVRVVSDRSGGRAVARRIPLHEERDNMKRTLLPRRLLREQMRRPTVKPKVESSATQRQEETR